MGIFDFLRRRPTPEEPARTAPPPATEPPALVLPTTADPPQPDAADTLVLPDGTPAHAEASPAPELTLPDAEEPDEPGGAAAELELSVDGPINPDADGDLVLPGGADTELTEDAAPTLVLPNGTPAHAEASPALELTLPDAEEPDEPGGAAAELELSVDGPVNPDADGDLVLPGGADTELTEDVTPPAPQVAAVESAPASAHDLSDLERRLATPALAAAEPRQALSAPTAIYLPGAADDDEGDDDEEVLATHHAESLEPTPQLFEDDEDDGDDMPLGAPMLPVRPQATTTTPGGNHMDIYLVRHAEAFDRDALAWPEDEERPLTPKGLKRWRKAARGLREVAPAATVVLSSPLVRAWETAEQLTERTGWPEPEECEALTPDGTPDEVLAELQRQPSGATVALVGHEPSLSRLLAVLLGTREGGEHLPFDKGGVAYLTFAAAPAAGEGTLRWLVTPKLLRALAGKGKKGG